MKCAIPSVLARAGAAAAALAVFSIGSAARDRCFASSISWDYPSFTGSLHADTYAEVFAGPYPPETCHDGDDAVIPASAGQTATATSNCRVSLGASDAHATTYTGSPGDCDFRLEAFAITQVVSWPLGAGGAHAAIRFVAPFAASSDLQMDLGFHFQAEGSEGGSQVEVSLVDATGAVLDRFQVTTYAWRQYDETETVSALLAAGRRYQLEVFVEVSVWDENFNGVTLDDFSEAKAVAAEPGTWGGIKRLFR